MECSFFLEESKRVAFLLLVFVLSGLMLQGCHDSDAPTSMNSKNEVIIHTGDTQGTTYLIKYHEAEAVPQSAIDSVLEAVDVEFNLWRPDSRINAINAFSHRDSLFTFVDDNGLWSSIWAQSLDLFEASEGAFDPTVQPLVELWGFGLRKRSEVTPMAVDSALMQVGMTFENIDLNEVERDRNYQFTTVRKRNPRTCLDFNGIAQGMTVDLLTDMLEERGVKNYMVEVGGEVKCGGNRMDGKPAINAFSHRDSLFTFVDENGLWSSIWAQSLDLFEASEGAFDPTVQPLVELWGFGLRKRSEVTPMAVDSALMHVGMTFENIDLNEVERDRNYQFTTVRKRNPRTCLDFNGIAQGMTVDLLTDMLEERGVKNYMVEVGGEVKCGGNRMDGKPWRIAVDRPTEPVDGDYNREMQTVMNVSDAAICTSGNYRKFYEMDGIKRSHTISPFSGYPVQHGLLSATVHATSASTADALATACMVWGPEDGKQFILAYRNANPFDRVEAYFISDDGEGNWANWVTPGWQALTAIEIQE